MIYFQVIGPNKNLNNQFIEKMSNKKFSELNDFRETTEMNFDPGAQANYFILPNNIEMEHSMIESWMKFYYDNSSMVWVREF